MQSPFTAKRKARRITRNDDGDEENRAPGLEDDIADNTTAVVRPSISSRNPSRSKRSGIRTSFATGDAATNEDQANGESTHVLAPKKLGLGRQAIERNAAQVSLDASRSGSHADGPNYSAASLKELKASTPSIPRDLRSRSENADSEGHELDLAAKFGPGASLTQNVSGIPTDAEIQEKKERRKRLAKEQEYISLNSDGEDARDEENSGSDASSNHETSVLPYAGPTSRREKPLPSRTAQDEDEFGEGYDALLADEMGPLGKKAERLALERNKAEMKSMIEDAEGTDSSSDDESEKERQAAYQAAQTRKGMDGLQKGYEGSKPRRPQTPPKISPLPSLGGVLERLKEQKDSKAHEKKLQQARLDGVRKELTDIEIRKVEVQKLMTEAGERYAKLRDEVAAEEERGKNAPTDVAVVQYQDGKDDVWGQSMDQGSDQHETGDMAVDQPDDSEEAEDERPGLGAGVRNPAFGNAGAG